MTSAEVDPIGPAVARAIEDGWRLIEQVGIGYPENALVRRYDNGVTDLVTLPEFGDSTVVRLFGGAQLPDHPRRTGEQVWRVRVPVTIAIEWALGDPNDDALLRQWSRTTGWP
jgi:hypothetical protein